MGQSINGPCSELNWVDPDLLHTLGARYAFGQVSRPHIVIRDEHDERLVWVLDDQVLKDCACELRMIALRR